MVNLMKEIMMLIPIVVVQKKQRAVLWEAGAGGGHTFSLWRTGDYRPTPVWDRPSSQTQFYGGDQGLTPIEIASY